MEEAKALDAELQERRAAESRAHGISHHPARKAGSWLPHYLCRRM